MTLSFNDSSCVDVSSSVTWPGTRASLRHPLSCREPVSVTVQAINNAGLAGPAALVLVSNTSSTLNSTSAISDRSRANDSVCISGSELCLLRWIDSQVCSVYERDGRVLIVNRTETTIAVQLVFSFSIPQRSGLIVVRMTAD